MYLIFSPIIGPMGGWVGPEGFCWEFAPSEASAAEPSKWGTSYWLPSAPALRRRRKTHEGTSTQSREILSGEVDF